MKHPFHLINLVTLKKVSSLFAGNYKTSFHGTGIEFAGIREYTFGDDTADIDWKTTARTGKTYIKKYEEDRERKVLFLLDMGESMRFGSGEKTKFDTLFETFSILSFSSVENDDPIGAWFFSDKVLRMQEVKKWVAHLGKMRKDFEKYRGGNLCKMPNSYSNTPLLTPRTTSYGSLRYSIFVRISSFFRRFQSRWKWKYLNFDTEYRALESQESSTSAVISELFKRKIRNHLIFLFSDSLELPNGKEYRTVADQNDIVFVHIFDTFENALDATDPLHGVSSRGDIFLDSTDIAKKEEYCKIRSEEIENFRKNILSFGGSYLSLDESKNPYQELYTFFKKRQGR